MNNRGGAIAIVVVTGAIISFLGVVAAYLMSQNDLSIKREQHRASAYLIKQNLFSLIDNDAAWSAIVRANASLSCLQTDGATCTGPFGTLRIVNADGSVVLDNSATEGFDLAGNRCTTFDAVNGDDTCVYKFEVTADCSGACGTTLLPAGMIVSARPKVVVQASFKYMPKTTSLRSLINVNSTQYTFNFIRGNQDQTLSKYCASINGIFDSTNQACKALGATPDDFDCTVISGPHSWFVGFAADGSPQCAQDVKVGVGCSNVTAIVGILPDGSFRCAGY